MKGNDIMDLLVRSNLMRALEARIENDMVLKSIDKESFFVYDVFNNKSRQKMKTCLKIEMFEGNDDEFYKYVDFIVTENRCWRRKCSETVVDIVDMLEKCGAYNLGNSMYTVDYDVSKPLTVEKVKAYVKLIEIWTKATKFEVKKLQSLVNVEKNEVNRQLYKHRISELISVIKDVARNKEYLQASVVVMKDFTEFCYHHYTMFKEYKDYSVDINKCLHELVKEMIAKIANRYPHLQIGVVYLLSKAIVSSPDWVCKTYGAETFNIELTD